MKNYILEESIGYIVRNFTGNLRSSILNKLSQAGIDIHIDIWVALAFLNRYENKNQQQLGKLLVQDKTAVTRLIDSMEKQGLVERKINKEDKRNKIINLTETGRNLYLEIVPHIEETIQKAYKDISKDEIELTKSILLKMHRNLIEE